MKRPAAKQSTPGTPEMVLKIRRPSSRRRRCWPESQLHLEFEEEITLGFEPPDASVESMFDEGCKAQDSGDHALAVRIYREALELNGPNAVLCFNLANSLLELGKIAEASERFRQSIEIEPGYWDAWNNLGICLCELEDKNVAISAY